jgi:hypothetical protein
MKHVSRPRPGHRLPGTLLLVCFVGLAGCGQGSKKVQVVGKVTLNGQLLKDPVRVNFKCSDNNVLSATTDENGEYRIDDVPLGTTIVTVTSASPGVAGGGQVRGRGQADEAGKPKRESAPRTEIPAEYQDPVNPALRFEVTEGDNVYNIVMVTRKK